MQSTLTKSVDYFEVERISAMQSRIPLDESFSLICEKQSRLDRSSVDE